MIWILGRFNPIHQYDWLRSIAATQHYSESIETLISHVYTYCTKNPKLVLGDQ